MTTARPAIESTGACENPSNLTQPKINHETPAHLSGRAAPSSAQFQAGHPHQTGGEVALRFPSGSFWIKAPNQNL